MGLREVLIIIMVLVIAVILFDGFRRVRMARQNSLKMKIRPGRSSFSTGEEEFSPELPSGGARLVKREQDNDDSGEGSGGTVPMLMESVAREDRQGAGEDTEVDSREQHDLFDQPMTAGERITDIPGNEAGEGEGNNQAGEPEEVIVIHLLSSKDSVFGGRELLQQLLACGMRFGDMNIFHRFTSPAGQGELLFSMANAVKPGTFDIDNMEETETPGVSFFLQLPGPSNPGHALDTMIEVTEKLARELEGELLDENRSVLTRQTVEHMRNRVQEFIRQQKLKS